MHDPVSSFSDMSVETNPLSPDHAQVIVTKGRRRSDDKAGGTAGDI